MKQANYMSENQINITDYTIRNYLPSDFESLNNLWQITNMGGSYRGDNPQIIETTINNGGSLWVIFHHSTLQIIGSSWLTNDFRRIYLHHFAIHPQFQGKGLSHPLLKKSLEWVKEKGLQVKLEVHKDNEKALNLYKKYGFTYLGDYQVQIIRDISLI